MDFLIALILFLPFWYILVEQQFLTNNGIFFKHLSISLVALGGGIIYHYFSKTPDKELVYFISQMPFSFIILYRIIRIPYFSIYKREPEISRHPEKNIDIIPSLLVMGGCVVLPFLIDIYIIKCGIQQ